MTLMILKQKYIDSPKDC